MKILEVQSSNIDNKSAFYGFRKAFIQDSTIPLESRYLIILLFTYKGKNTNCWPSVGKLANNMGRNKDTVRKYLRTLQKLGYLNIKSRGIGRSNFYIPSYFKISSGIPVNNVKESKHTEETIHQPNETTLNRSINSGNKDSTFKTGKELFNQKRKELGLI